MDIGNKFSLVDFLAYLFPGIVSTLGLFLLLLLTPLGPLLLSLPIDLATGVLVLVLSYVIGVLLSGFAEIAVKWIARITHRTWSRETIRMTAFRPQILAAFHALFEEDTEPQDKWMAQRFYLCRSLVFEHMPALAPFIQRQGSLRELRMNLLPAITVWLSVGIAWGTWAIRNGMVCWGYALIAGSVALWVLVGWVLYNRMNRNEQREVREVLTAFLAGYKSGLFDRAKDAGPK